MIVMPSRTGEIDVRIGLHSKYFRPGDIISGVVELELKSALKVQLISMKCEGKATVKTLEFDVIYLISLELCPNYLNIFLFTLCNIISC